MNPIQEAVAAVGGVSAAARIVRKTPRAVRKWMDAGRLPRTEATGETNYAELLAKANRRISKSALVATCKAKRTAERST